MGQGRCAGCGETGPETEVTVHTVSCPDYARLYRDHPERALLPAAEQARWLEQDKTAETASRVAAKTAAGNDQRSAMADRFRTRDLLEE
jgi:hypothetical protein